MTWLPTQMMPQAIAQYTHFICMISVSYIDTYKFFKTFHLWKMNSSKYQDIKFSYSKLPSEEVDRPIKLMTLTLMLYVIERSHWRHTDINMILAHNRKLFRCDLSFWRQFCSVCGQYDLISKPQWISDGDIFIAPSLRHILVWFTK